MKYQFGTSNVGQGGRRTLPFAFCEQGVAMMSALLRSDIAVKVSIEIMNAFVEMRKMLISNASLFHRLNNIELKQLQADQKFEEIFKALKATSSTAKMASSTTVRFSMLTPLCRILYEVPKAPLSCWITTWTIQC